MKTRVMRSVSCFHRVHDKPRPVLT